MNKFAKTRIGNRCYVLCNGQLLEGTVRSKRMIDPLGIVGICVDTIKLGSFLFDEADGYYLGRRSQADVGSPTLLTCKEAAEHGSKIESLTRLANSVATLLKMDLADSDSDTIDEADALLNEAIQAIRGAKA